MKIAHTIEIDHENGQLIIEGVPFDYYVRDDIEYGDLDGKIGYVTMSVYTDNLVVHNKVIHSTTHLTPEHRAKIETEWARREAKRIVHERMAHILEWLVDLEKMPKKWVTGLPNGSQPTMLSDDSETH